MFSQAQLNSHIEAGWIRVQKHPDHDLFIYNYTQAAQYARTWDEITLNCRGLILDNRMNTIARPFRKFFNLGEMENQIIPDEPFEVFEKLDGSLGIMYWIDGEAFIASRGSFASKQSAVANQMLHSKYKHLIRALDPTKTYLFEIIYPENRIVVNYGEQRDLILLGIVDTASGQEEPLTDIGFPVAGKHDGIQDIGILRTLEESNREGFVIRFQSGLRYKVKFEEYVRIHRLVTQVSNLSIWENLKTGSALDELLNRVPDEFYNWVRRTRNELAAKFAVIENTCKAEFKVLSTRKETAIYFQQCQYPAVLFKMLDGKSYDDAIWRIIRPEFAKPFSTLTNC